ncbi:MAG TPA: PrsW family glutamic-type intramembrane protease [Thermomicrobiales bacterium]
MAAPAGENPNAAPEIGHCVVCDLPVEGRRHELGGRIYCDEHYARATLGSRGTWPAIGAMIAGLVILAVVMLIVGDRISEELSDNWIALIGLGVSLLPGVLWLLVFRHLDKLEAEPHTFLLSMFALGALLAGTIGEPLRRGLLDLHRWQPDSWFWSVAVHTLTQGVVQALLVYIAVRWTVYLTDEFDERADGIIYGTAAGLGIATLLNINYVLDNRGLNLDVGTTRIIVDALALAALGGVVGYGLGQVKFERHAPWFVALWVAVAAVLNGVFEWLQSEVTAQELGFEGWPALLFAGAFAVVVFGFVFYLLRVAVRETLSRAGRTTATATGEH